MTHAHMRSNVENEIQRLMTLMHQSTANVESMTAIIETANDNIALLIQAADALNKKSAECDATNICIKHQTDLLVRILRNTVEENISLKAKYEAVDTSRNKKLNRLSRIFGL